MTEVELIVVKSSSFKEVGSCQLTLCHDRRANLPSWPQFCRLFYESHVLASCILNLQLAFQKLAAVAPAAK
jgi:hypothetical protein